MSLYGIARGYALEGRKESARKGYVVFLAAWTQAEQDLTQVAMA